MGRYLRSLIILALLTAVFAAPALAKTKRHTSQKNAFKRTHTCPSTGVASTESCPGWTVDHIKPLKRGGADKPSNMQWQTNQDAKAKDKWE